MRLIVSASVSGPSDSGSRPPKNAARESASAAIATRSSTASGQRGDNGAITAAGARQRRPTDHRRGLLANGGTRRQHLGAQLGGRAQPGVDDEAGRAQDRIAQLVVADRRDRPVAGFDVGAGVAHEAHGAQVQERRPAVRPHPRGEIAGDVVGVGEVAAVGELVAELGDVAERGLDPSRGGRHADAPPVVLAHEQQRERQTLMGGVPGGVDRALRRRVVGTGVTERADRERIDGPRRRHAETFRTADRERHAECPGQVRRDRRRLGDDGEVGVAEHLVPAAGDRLVGERQHPGEHVANAVVTRNLSASVPGRSRRSGSAAAPDRWGAGRRRRRHCPRGRPIRSCRSRRPACATSAPCDRRGG